MRNITTGRVRKAVLQPVTVLLIVLGLVLTSGPAQAAIYTAHTDRYAARLDPGGIATESWLNKVGVGRTKDYWIAFNPDGEKLQAYIDPAMVSNGKITVVVYDRSGQHVDTDRITLKVNDPRTFQLGTPDGTRNIPEGYDVYTRICVGLSDTCTPYVMGNA